mmetsp:Transcript_9636/g.30537  ORF Transcript_9636/g.30537 Transcript_9636/m.30537 type:complete len:226 (-) Transcript_9636:49-726(-)
MRFMRDQAEHNQVGVEAVDAVRLVRNPVGFLLTMTDPLDDLVLAFARHLVSGQDNFDATPQVVLRNLFADEKVKVLGQLTHKLCTWRNLVRVKDFFLGQRDTLCKRSLTSLAGLVSRTKTARPLLVHLRAGSNAVNRQVKDALGTYKVKETIDVVENVYKNLLIVHDVEECIVVRVRTAVNDAIHVQVKIVNFWQWGFGQSSVHERITLRQPTKEFRNTHREKGG